MSSIPSRADGDEQVYERTKKGLVRLKKTLKDNAEEDLVAAFKGGVACVNGHRKKMGYMFDHDDVHKKAA